MIEIQLPKEVQDILEGDLLDSDGLILDDSLNKALVYLPETIRQFGLACADLRMQSKLMSEGIKLATHDLEVYKSKIILGLDFGIYKSEDLRLAKVYSDSGYNELFSQISQKKKDLIELEHELSELEETLWKLKNLQNSLSDLTKLRISERRF